MANKSGVIYHKIDCLCLAKKNVAIQLDELYTRQVRGGRYNYIYVHYTEIYTMLGDLLLFRFFQ